MKSMRRRGDRLMGHGHIDARDRRHTKLGPHHLPDKKRDDLERVVAILFEKFADAVNAATQKWKIKAGLKIMLYGSFARNDWVKDPMGGYFEWIAGRVELLATRLRTLCTARLSQM